MGQMSLSSVISTRNLWLWDQVTLGENPGVRNVLGRVRKSRLVIHADLEERALPLGLYTCRWGLIMPFRKAGVEVYRLETSFYTAENVESQRRLHPTPMA